MYSIEIKNLVKEYKNKTAVNNVSFNIIEGKIFALLGTNGAIKTAIIKILSSLISLTSGSVKVMGLDKDKIRELINFSTQETVITLNLSVLENL